MTVRRNPDKTISFLNEQGQEKGRYAGKKWEPKLILPYIVARWEEKDWVTILAICLAESGGWDQAEGDLLLQHPRLGTSIGFMQIRTLKNEPYMDRGVNRKRSHLLLPDNNFDAAHALWEREGLTPWGAYRDGNYLKQIKRANRTVSEYFADKSVYYAKLA